MLRSSYAALCLCSLSFVSASCTNSEDQTGEATGSLLTLIEFSPSYSAYDGVHDYAVTPYIPSAATDSEASDPIDAASVHWETDANYVKREPFNGLPGGILLTTKRTGKTELRVSATTRSGNRVRSAAMLFIAKADAMEWQAGKERYEASATIDPNIPAMAPSDVKSSCGLDREQAKALPRTSACASCHAAGSSFSQPATPTQVAGYTDDELIALFSEGTIPAEGIRWGSYLRQVEDPDCLFKAFHSWELSEAEAHGLVWQLRSLAPEIHESDEAERH